MKKRDPKRLALRTETIRQLSPGDLGKIQAGLEGPSNDQYHHAKSCQSCGTTTYSEG